MGTFDALWAQLAPHIQSGNFRKAMDIAEKTESALSTIMLYGMSRIQTARRREDIEKAMEESLIEVIPRLEKRTHYLATLANVGMLMGLLGIWNNDFLGASTVAVLPYAQYLKRFPAYLQQLTMESNGKHVTRDGHRCNYQTGPIYWGEPGTNGQHSFYQLIHQGTRLIPADFIAVANPANPLVDGDNDVHALFLANFFAQTAALAFGKTAEEVRAEGTAEAIVPARVFPGNRPTTSIMAPELSPRVVGELIALYEHITFTEGVVWGIDSFDQWGVELGKQLALQIAPAVSGDDEALAKQDSSTQSLITHYRSQRK